MEPKVSIIIPVYNPGELLVKCLDSVASQTLSEIECICVNDESTDNSFEILQEYAKKDFRFKILTQKHSGAGVARNYGIENAKGEFILFLDSDDWIEDDTCEKLYAQATRLNTDLVLFDVFWHTEDEIKKFSYFSNNEFDQYYESFVFDYHFIKSKVMIGNLGVIWSKFYKSSFIKENNIRFPKHKIYNDVEFHFKSILFAEKISYLPKYFYHYIRLGQPSLQTSFRESKDELIWVDVITGIHNILKENNFLEFFRLEFINYCIYYSFDKLKNIDSKFEIIFLKRLKSFFRLLNPNSNELNQLKTSNLNWYNYKTVKYLPIYDELMNNNIQSLQSHFFKIETNELNNIHQKEINNLNKSHKNKIDELNNIHQKEINNLNKSHKNKITELENILKIKEQENDNLKEINQINKEENEFIINRNNDLNNLLIKKDKRIDILLNENKKLNYIKKEYERKIKLYPHEWI